MYSNGVSHWVGTLMGYLIIGVAGGTLMGSLPSVTLKGYLPGLTLMMSRFGRCNPDIFFIILLDSVPMSVQGHQSELPEEYQQRFSHILICFEVRDM